MTCPACGTALTADSVFCRKCGTNVQAVAQAAPAAKKGVSIGRIVLWGVLAVALGFSGLITYEMHRANANIEEARRRVRDAHEARMSELHAPRDLMDSVEVVDASSWRAFPLTLPVAGDVKIEVKVQRGNAMDVTFIPESSLAAMKAGQDFDVYPALKADKTKLYKRAAKLGAGTYYLVLSDKTLGLLSAGDSDVAIKVRHEPVPYQAEH